MVPTNTKRSERRNSPITKPFILLLPYEVKSSLLSSKTGPGQYGTPIKRAKRYVLLLYTNEIREGSMVFSELGIPMGTNGWNRFGDFLWRIWDFGG